MKKFQELYSRRKNYHKTFGTEEGKMVLADLYKACGMDRPSYVEGNPDRTAYNEGMKRIGLRIKSILKQSDKQLNELAKYHDDQLSNYRSIYNK
jgi:soluble cytochrome b562